MTTTMIITRLLLILCVFFNVFISSLTHEINNVELAQILFRHGERSPTHSYANDPYKNHEWPGGFDQLTNKGKLQLYDLGVRLRKQYEDFLIKYYNVSDVYVHSSYADRCQMSAQLLLAGLYPPVDNQIWKPNLLWQPIPVHVIPRHLDNKIALKKNCPKYLDELAKVYTSEKLVEINKQNNEFYAYLSKNTGDNITTLADVETLYNTLEIEQLNNLTLPEWTKEVFGEKMKEMATMNLALYTDTEFMKRMHGGMFVKEIIETMVNKTENISNLQLKLFSGHDLTLVSILNCLNLPLVKPQFGAALIFELHKSSKYYVKILYKENPYADAKTLKLPMCEDPCELSTFKNVLLPILPNDWDKECVK